MVCLGPRRFWAVIVSGKAAARAFRIPVDCSPVDTPERRVAGQPAAPPLLLLDRPLLCSLLRTLLLGVLAISQPAHAWISGQILCAWQENLGEALLLAAEQHDVGWLDWETEPTFDPKTGRPHLFREVGAATHAPMWAKGVQRARDAWGPTSLSSSRVMAG
jgi:hypothetical protein